MTYRLFFLISFVVLMSDSVSAAGSSYLGSCTVLETTLPSRILGSIVLKVDGFEKETIDESLDALTQPSYFLDLSGDDITIDKLEKISRNPMISGLDLSGTYLNNTGLKIISTMPLRFLGVSENRFDDEGMLSIASMNQLVELKVRYNKVTSLGIAPLQKLENLRVLDASCTYLADEGIQALSNCKKIESLDVQACGFGDAALDYILNMQSLKFVNISDNRNLTEEGVSSFLFRKKYDLVVQYASSH